MPERPVVACDDCQAPVIWAVDADNPDEQIRVDALPIPDGDVALEISANTPPIAHRGLMAHTFAQDRTGLHKAHKATCKTWPPRVPAHAFARDDRVPADWYGRRWCLCGVPGEPGDQRHPADAPALHPPTDQAVVEQAALERDAAILGERPDDQDLLTLAARMYGEVDPPPAGMADRAAERLAADQRGRDTAS
jgi:hypothetical protein